MAWADTNLCTLDDLKKYEPDLEDWGFEDKKKSQQKINLAKSEIERRLKVVYKGMYASIERKESENDLVTTAGSAVVTSADSLFITNDVKINDNFVITEGEDDEINDKGIHKIKSIDSETRITLKNNLTASNTAISFYIEKPLLDLILNPEALQECACFLTLHYICLELKKHPDDTWSMKAVDYENKYKDEWQIALDLIHFDIDEDKVADRDEQTSVWGGIKLDR